jgi:hypothetical protein
MISLLIMKSSIAFGTVYSIRKNGAKVTEELRIVVWRPVYSNYGAVKSPGLGQCPSSNIFHQNYICMSAVVSSSYGATTEDAESLIAQLHSQCKLTTQRRENRKILHENAILKENDNNQHV